MVKTKKRSVALASDSSDAQEVDSSEGHDDLD